MSKLELLQAEWDKAEIESKRWLAVVNSEKDHILNMIATIHMNACTQIKNEVAREYGSILLKERKDKLPDLGVNVTDQTQIGEEPWGT